MSRVKDWEGWQHAWARQLSERGWRLMETNVSCFCMSKGDWGRLLSLSPRGISHFGKNGSEFIVKTLWTREPSLDQVIQHANCFTDDRKGLATTPLISPFFKKKKKVSPNCPTVVRAKGKTWKQEKLISQSQPLIELQNWDNDANEYY